MRRSRDAAASSDAGDAAETTDADSHAAAMPTSLPSADVSDLTCPLCLDIPEKTIHQCTNGHIFCAECLTAHRESGRSASRKCPTCRVGLSGAAIRNRIAEAAVGMLPGPCKGCGGQMLRKDLAEHERTCDEVSVPCPFPGCATAVRRKDLAEHQQTAAAHHLALAQEGARQLEQKAALLASLDVKVEVRLADVEVAGRVSPPPPPFSLLLRLFERIDAQAAFQQTKQTIVDTHFRMLRQLPEAATTVKLTYSQGTHSMNRRTLDASKTPHELLMRDGARIFVEVTTPAPPPPPPPLLAPPKITIHLIAPDGMALQIHGFRLSLDTQLEKLMRIFTRHHNMQLDSVRFLYRGHPIRPEQTAEELGMLQYDEIHVVHAA